MKASWDMLLYSRESLPAKLKSVSGDFCWELLCTFNGFIGHCLYVFQKPNVLLWQIICSLVVKGFCLATDFFIKIYPMHIYLAKYTNILGFVPQVTRSHFGLHIGVPPAFPIAGVTNLIRIFYENHRRRYRFFFLVKCLLEFLRYLILGTISITMKVTYAMKSYMLQKILWEAR